MATVLCASLLSPLIATADVSTFVDAETFSTTTISEPDNRDFESETPGPVPAGGEVGGLTIDYDDSLYTVVVNDEFGTTSGTRSLGTASEDQAFVGGDWIHFDFGRTVQGMGLRVIVGEENLDPAFFSLVSFGAVASSPPMTFEKLSDGSVYFLGIVDETGFDSVILFSSGIEDLVFNIDDVVLVDVASVPEPASAGLQLAATLTLVALARLRRSLTG